MRKALLLLLAIATMSAADKTKLAVHVMNERGHPIDRASVIITFVQGRSIKLNKIRKTWELKTSQEGLARIPEIPQGKIKVQINAKNYQTFGEIFDVQEEERTIEITLKVPQPQYSVH